MLSDSFFLQSRNKSQQLTNCAMHVSPFALLTSVLSLHEPAQYAVFWPILERALWCYQSFTDFLS